MRHGQETMIESRYKLAADESMQNTRSQSSQHLQVQALLAPGSNVAAPDREGRSPLHYAAAG